MKPFTKQPREKSYEVKGLGGEGGTYSIAFCSLFLGLLGAVVPRLFAMGTHVPSFLSVHKSIKLQKPRTHYCRFCAALFGQEDPWIGKHCCTACTSWAAAATNRPGGEPASEDLPFSHKSAIAIGSGPTIHANSDLSVKSQSSLMVWECKRG